MNRILVAVVMLLVGAASADAQICGGAPSFGEAPYQAGVAAAFHEDARGVGARFAAGGSAVFGGAGLSFLSFDAVESTQTDVSAFAGAELAVDASDRVFICPVGIVSFGVGPDIGATDVSSVGFEGGGSVGVVASSTQTLMVVPTFGLSAVWQRVTAEVGATEVSESDTFGAARLGVGFIFNRRVGITPGVSIPFSAGDADVVFSLGFTFNFGG
jgi:hypothetical protein